MSKRKRLVMILVALVLLIGASAFWVLARYGLELGLAAQRRALGELGLTRHELPSPLGDQVVFENQNRAASTVVLIHGFGDQASTWSTPAKALSERFHLLIPDLPGHGDSAPTGDELTYEQLYGTLEAVLQERTGFSPVTLVGNSLGGWLSMRYALDHPEQVERLVLVNAAGLDHPIDKGLLIPKSREALAEKLDRLLPPETQPKLPGFVQDQLIEMTDLPRLDSLFDSLQASGGLDARLPQMSVPTTLVWGTPDGFFPLDYARRLEAAIPGATLRELPGCGHAPQVVCGTELSELLLELLR